MPGGFRRFILWDYPRASVQYDVIVGLILAFIFLTPRFWFRDQPRTPQASQVVMLGAGRGSGVVWIEPELLAGVAEDQQMARVSRILKARTGRVQTVTRVQPILDSEQEIQGYMAFVRP